MTIDSQDSRCHFQAINIFVCNTFPRHSELWITVCIAIVMSSLIKPIRGGIQFQTHWFQLNGSDDSASFLGKFHIGRILLLCESFVARENGDLIFLFEQRYTVEYERKGESLSPICVRNAANHFGLSFVNIRQVVYQKESSVYTLKVRKSLYRLSKECTLPTWSPGV